MKRDYPTVDLDLPIYGATVTEHNTPDPCPACGGTGERRVEIPFGWYLADCSACDGLGVVS